MFGEADVEFPTLDQSQIQVLSGLQCSEEDRPKLRAEDHEKMTAWLAALPGSVHKHVEEKVLVTTWKKEHLFGALVEFIELKKQSSEPTTPSSLSQNSAVTNLASPEYTGMSPAKLRVVEAENVDPKFTPLDKVGSTWDGPSSQPPPIDLDDI